MRPRVAYFFYLLKDDDYMKEFCVAGACDPEQYVQTKAPDGSWQRWAKRHEGDLLVFHPPDGYAGDQPLLWVYNKRRQKGVAMPRRELERRALAMRTSVALRTVEKR